MIVATAETAVRFAAGEVFPCDVWELFTLSNSGKTNFGKPREIARFFLFGETTRTKNLNSVRWRITFHKYLSPFNPAEDIEELVEFDPNAISDALGG